MDERNRSDSTSPERSLATLAVAALEAHVADTLFSDAAELLSASLGTPVTVARGGMRPVIGVVADADPLDGAHRQLLDDAASVVRAAAERLAVDANPAAGNRRLLEDGIQYRKLVEELPLITYIDLPGVDIPTVYLGPQIEEILGYPAEMLLGAGDLFFDRVLPEDRQRARDHARRALDGVAGETEYRIEAADGRTVWLLDRSIPQFDPDGSVACVRGFMIDITREKEAAAAAARSDERNRALVESVPAIVYVDKPNDTASSIYLSPRFEDLLGYPVATISDPERIALEQAGERGTLEYRCKAKDGRIVWVHEEAIPQLDEVGNVVAVRGYIFDVTYSKRLEAERLEAEERYRALVEHLPGIVYLDAPDEGASAIYVSPQAESILGYSTEEWLRSPEFFVRQVVHPDDRERVVAGIADANAGEGRRSEYRCVAKDGRVVWFYDESSPELDPRGNVVANHGFMLDITDHKIAEAERSEAESEFRRLVEELPLITYHESGGDDLPTDYVSPQVEQILGYPPEHLTGPGERFYDLVHPDDRQSTEEHTRRALAGEVVESEYRMLAADGRLVWLLDRSIPQFGEHGEVVKVRGFLLDITDRKRIELERRAAEEEYRTLLEELPGVVYVDAADETGSTLYMSPQVETLLGYSLDEWLSSPSFFVDAVLHPDDRETVLAEIEANNAGVRNRSEYRCITKSGDVMWIYDESVPQLDDDGTVVATRGFMLDITDQKLAEEELRRRDDLLRQAQRMEAVGRLAGGVAHDFNNLLTVIKGHVDLLSYTDDLDEHLREELAAVAAAAERAAGLTRQLLAFSRQQVLQPAVLDLGEVVSGLTQMLRRLLERIALRVESEPDLWSALVDRTQVEQEIVNLVVNARDAMPQGGTISIETRNTVVAAGDYVGAPPGDYVTLKVADTGIGVEPEVRRQMFEPFYTTKDVGEGTGLGLATVHGIVQQSGGLISVDSAPGEGTAFTVLLPRVDAAVSPPARCDSRRRRSREGRSCSSKTTRTCARWSGSRSRAPATR